MPSHIRSPPVDAETSNKIPLENGWRRSRQGPAATLVTMIEGRVVMTANILPEPKTDASAEYTPNALVRNALLDDRNADDAGRGTRRVRRGLIVDVAGYAACLWEVTTCTK